MANQENILLKEYETCQSHINSLGYQYWIGVGVFMAINTALLASLVYGVLQREDSSVQLSQILVPAVMVLILGAGMITILLFLISWLTRITSTIRICHERMREIEAELGMWRGWIIHGLDHPAREGGVEGFNNRKIDREMQSKLINHHPPEWWERWRSCRVYRRPIGFQSVKSIFYTLISVWGIFIILALVGVVKALLSL